MACDRAQAIERLKACVSVLISGIGEDGQREGLRDTPEVGLAATPAADCAMPALGLTVTPAAMGAAAQRVARAWLDMTAGYQQDPARCMAPRLPTPGAARHQRCACACS